MRPALGAAAVATSRVGSARQANLDFDLVPTGTVIGLIHSKEI